MKQLLIIGLGFLLTGCSSSSTPRPDLPTVSIEQAKTQPAKYLGTRVFWGGTILKVSNFRDHSQIEVLRRPLSGSEPNDQKKGQGRFMIKVAGFIDPAEYKSPNRVTVIGTLQDTQKGKVGNYPYTYPYVIAEKIQFWRGKKSQPIRDPYWWDHPYYRPFPYYSHPYSYGHFGRGYW